MEDWRMNPEFCKWVDSQYLNWREQREREYVQKKYGISATAEFDSFNKGFFLATGLWLTIGIPSLSMALWSSEPASKTELVVTFVVLFIIGVSSGFFALQRLFYE